MAMMTSSGNGIARKRGGLVLLLILLAVSLGALFFRSFLPGQALFANDGPLGLQMAAAYQVPQGFTGMWSDLQWLGGDAGYFMPNISGMLHLILGPLGFINFAGAVSLMIVGMSAGLFFRVLGFRPAVCVIAGLAAGLNMNTFSNVCWGLIGRATGPACIFLALAAVYSARKSQPILKSLLAGAAIGMSITESGDNGAIFSVYVAAFATFLVWLDDGISVRSTLKAAGRVVPMAIIAVLFSVQTFNLYHTISIKGSAQASQSPQERFNWATQWSLPKAETLRVIVPGLFGYRLDSPDGANYWGSVGQAPGWEEHHSGFPRHSGSGEYAGILTVLVAAFAVSQALRKKNSVFGENDRKLILFLAALAVVSVLLAWGRHAPFYQIIYALPYFSTIRNPMKYMHPFHLLTVILFGYGLQALAKGYLEKAGHESETLMGRLAAWWRGTTAFEHRWVKGCVIVFCASVLGTLLYLASRKGVVDYLAAGGFPGELGAKIYLFSLGELGKFLLYFAIAVGVVALIVSGALSGRRAALAWLVLGVFTVTDLARADKPWIQYYDYEERFATNPVLDVLRKDANQHRVITMPFQWGEQFGAFQQFYHVEWLQHQFPYYSIQSFDVAQMSRMQEDYSAFMTTVGTRPGRLWQLCNVQYFFAPANAVDSMNQNLDPVRKRFRLRMPFTLAQTSGGRATAITNAAGPYALVEFGGALPRVRLYGQWESPTNEQATLSRLVAPDFDPEQTVLVPPEVPPSEKGAPSEAGTVTYIHHQPTRMVLRANATRPAILLYNDRYDSNWHVSVDGKPATLLRGNFIMRAVQVPAGVHEIEFRFRPDIGTLYIYLGACGVSTVLLGILLVNYRRSKNAPASTPPEPPGSSQPKNKQASRPA